MLMAPVLTARRGALYDAYPIFDSALRLNQLDNSVMIDWQI